VRGRGLKRNDAAEEVLPFFEAARRVGERPDDLRRRLSSAPVVRCGVFEAELRTTELVALRRLEHEVPRWRLVAEAARRKLRADAARGDRAARKALRELGEDLPAVRHWSCSERDDDEGGAA
jgi:hypothetical protein